MVWYFYQSQNKLQKKKGKIKQKKLENVTWRPGEVGPPQPSRPRGARGSSSPSRASKLLGGMPPSEPRTTRRRRVLPGLPVAFFSRLETPLFRPHPFPPPELPPPPPVFNFITTRERRRSPSQELVAIDVKESSQGVHRLRRPRLRHRAEGIDSRNSRAAVPFVVF